MHHRRVSSPRDGKADSVRVGRDAALLTLEHTRVEANDALHTPRHRRREEREGRLGCHQATSAMTQPAPRIAHVVTIPVEWLTS